MTVTEESRHRLHQALDRTIGEEEATTLMEHLPPVGWADVATKTDLAHLREHVDQRFELERAHVGHRFDQIDQRFTAEHDHVDHRFTAERIHTDGRFALIEERFEKVDVRFDGIDRRLDDMIKGFDRIESRLTYQFWQFLGLILAFGGVAIAVLRLT
jgi:hypothetical protein